MHHTSELFIFCKPVQGHCETFWLVGSIARTSLSLRKESLVPCKICGKLYFAGRLISDHMKKTHGVKLDKFNGDGIFIFNKCEICNILVPCKKMSAHMMAKHNHLNSGKRKSHDSKVVTRYKIKDGIAIAAKVDLDDNKNDDEAEDYVGDLKTSTFVVSEEGKILDDNEKTGFCYCKRIN